MGEPGGAGAKGREAGETGKSRQRVVAWAGRGTRQGADSRDPGGWSWHPERRARGRGGRHASGGARPGAGAAWAMRPQVWGPGAASAPERRRGRSGAPGAHGRVWVLRRGGVGEPWPQARPEVSAPMSRKPGPWQADGPSLVLRFPHEGPTGRLRGRSWASVAEVKCARGTAVAFATLHGPSLWEKKATEPSEEDRAGPRAPGTRPSLSCAVPGAEKGGQFPVARRGRRPSLRFSVGFPRAGRGRGSWFPLPALPPLPASLV